VSTGTRSHQVGLDSFGDGVSGFIDDGELLEGLLDIDDILLGVLDESFEDLKLGTIGEGDGGVDEFLLGLVDGSRVLGRLETPVCIQPRPPI
jgi:hypothetical protein